MLDDSQDAARRAISTWAQQTVIFAICIRDEKDVTPADIAQRMLACRDKASKICDELWESAKRECPQPLKISDHTLRFADKILSWCSEYRSAGQT